MGNPHSGKNKTSAVCEAICGFHKQKTLEDTLRKVFREELKHVSLQQSTETVEETDVVNDAGVLDFLRALQDE